MLQCVSPSQSLLNIQQLKLLAAFYLKFKLTIQIFSETFILDPWLAVGGLGRVWAITHQSLLQNANNQTILLPWGGGRPYSRT